MKSANPLAYYFRDETGIEVFYRDVASNDSKENYILWCDLLARGKRVWACAGGDLHRCASDKALTTVYAENTKSETLLSRIKEGDFVCGAVGIRMCVGNVKMGGVGSFENEQLHISVGDFHKSLRHPKYRYRMDLFDDTGIVMSTKISYTSPFSLMYRTDTAVRFYRVEVVDETRNLRITVGNSIWNATMFSENKR